MIYYQVIGRGPAQLNDFTGTCVYDLKEQIKGKDECWVGKSDEEKEDLDRLRKEGKSFDFSKLLNEYEIDEENPLSVELHGKRLVTTNCTAVVKVSLSPPAGKHSALPPSSCRPW